ncbi:hypothetical protein F3Y22_tig00116989pilonHSYRG00069 [Hibiscus syriacus]|uniref:Glycoside hydrolase family 38 central domain-containing protein n=1 Tax=Hibiscus syriacus TaxID=106335 RepID=A0A6A2X638_HIBSY|nr:hypothetical protein F3Y22_tig00116989pilonHSYRG00069 [Hibiscus syriacus]
MSGYYLAARQLEFFKGRNGSRPNTDSLADALAIAQHHDAVTGTEKQHVAYDYAKRLSVGYNEAENVVASSLACLTDSKSSIGCGDSSTNFQQCPLLNITYCPASETDLSHGKNLIVVIYNSLGWKREDVVRFPVVNEDVIVLDGQIELMLHRRLLLDDSRGVAEALNETDCIPGDCRGLTDGDNWMSSHTPTFSGIDASYNLPDNVALITLQELEGGKVLLRLAHLYEIGEDSVLSVMTRVELKKLFPGKKIAKVTEMSLSANQEREEMEKKRLVWEVEGEANKNPKVVRGSQVDPKKLDVELAPMEIRTFVIEFEFDLMTDAFKKMIDV